MPSALFAPARSLTALCGSLLRGLGYDLGVSMKNLLRGKVHWLLIVWMFLIAAITFLDRVNISISARFIEREFHLTHIQLGWVFSAFVLGYALFQAPGG